MSTFRYHRATDRITAGSWTLATGTARTGYGVTLLDDADPSSPCWISGTSIALVRDFGTATLVQTLYLINHTLTNAAQLHVQMHTADSWGAPDVDVAVTIPAAYADGYAYNLAVTLGATKRYLRVVNQSANPVSIAIGEIVMFPSNRTLVKNVQWGLIQPRVRLTSGVRAKRGVSTVYDFGGIERRLSGQIKANASDFDDLRALDADARGPSRPFVAVVNPSDTTARHAEPLYVRLAKSLTEAPQNFSTDVPVDLELDELGFGELVGA